MIDTGEIIANPQEIMHNHSELNKLINWIRNQDDIVLVVMESTGHYHYPVLKELYEAVVYVSVINAYLLKKYGDTEIRKVKTDKKDAIRIAKYAIEKRYSLTRYKREDEKYRDLRFLSRQYKDIYGIEASHGLISRITDKIIPLAQEWQNRPLYWLIVLTEIKNRGVKDIYIAAIYGLTGFKDAIKAVFHNTEIQRCIIHQIRNSTKYIPYKHRKEFCRDLKEIYTASTEN